MTAEIPPQPSPRLPIGGTSLQSRIAEAAIELFYSQGATATSVRDITSACGLTPGALYNHFSSKEQLLYVLIRDMVFVPQNAILVADQAIRAHLRGIELDLELHVLGHGHERGVHLLDEHALRFLR